jgi:hypothetical protein
VLFVATSQAGTSVTYNGTTVTKYTDYTPSTPVGTNCPPVKVFSLVNPSLGTNNISITTSGPTTVVAASYKGVPVSFNPLNNFGEHDTSNVQVATMTVGLTTTERFSWVVGFVENAGNATMAAGSGTTLRGQNVGTINSFGLAIFDNGAAVDIPALTNHTYDFSSGSGFLTAILYEVPEPQGSGNFFPFF